MKNLISIKPFFLLLLVLFISANTFAQTQTLLKRTTYKTDKLDFGAGGTVSIIGAPNGSIEIEGWQQNSFEISAEIEVQGASESDLAKLAEINNFVLEEAMGKIRLISVGTHDKDYMKRLGKKFPKHLLAMPFKIDYKIKVPQFCDLEIDGGKGDLKISGVDGLMKINYLSANVKLDLVGGILNATIGDGNVDISIPSRSWRGRFAEVQLAKGSMNVVLPPSLNAEITAGILRTGKIENSYPDLKPLTRKDAFTEKSITAKSGNGGISLKFTVGDGTLNISELKKR